MIVPRPLKHSWHLYRAHHWQIAGTPAESREATDAAGDWRAHFGIAEAELGRMQGGLRGAQVGFGFQERIGHVGSSLITGRVAVRSELPQRTSRP